MRKLWKAARRGTQIRFQDISSSVTIPIPTRLRYLVTGGPLLFIKAAGSLVWSQASPDAVSFTAWNTVVGPSRDQIIFPCPGFNGWSKVQRGWCQDNCDRSDIFGGDSGHFDPRAAVSWVNTTRWNQTFKLRDVQGQPWKSETKNMK